MKTVRLIVFIKAPVAGKVKTRLGQSVGMLNAARIYLLLCRSHLKKLARLTEVDMEVWAAPDTHHPFFLWCRRELGLTVRRQPEGDLGKRMYHSVKKSLREYSMVILTGSDMPSLGVSDIQQAVKHLGNGCDVVFTPANDGGYGLVAMKKPIHPVFYNMEWSRKDVLEVSLSRLRRRGYKYALLDQYDDIDTLSDYKKYFRCRKG